MPSLTASTSAGAATRTRSVCSPRKANRQNHKSSFVDQAARVFLMLLAAFFALAFVFDGLRRQDRRSLARSQFLFLDDDLSGFIVLLRQPASLASQKMKPQITQITRISH